MPTIVLISGHKTNCAMCAAAKNEDSVFDRGKQHGKAHVKPAVGGSVTLNVTESDRRLGQIIWLIVTQLLGETIKRDGKIQLNNNVD